MTTEADILQVEAERNAAELRLYNAAVAVAAEKDKPISKTSFTDWCRVCDEFESAVMAFADIKRKADMTPAALKALMGGDIENLIAASTPGGIEAQEKRGQIEQSFLETLPRDGTDGTNRKLFEALGFVFGTDADDIFVNVTFPKGWRKKVTNHDMWSDLVDDKDRKRGSIFYKAAFYDRSAHVHLSRRFSIGRYLDNQVTILDCENVSRVIGKHEQGDYAAMDRLEKEAKAWLAENYPNWNDVSAYWD